jgi:pepF/M3 family oligoendopeptidase
MAQHTELGALPRWDLSNVYPSLESAELAQDIEHSKRLTAELERYLDAHGISKDAPRQDHSAIKAALDGYLDRANALIKLYATLGAYIRAFVTTDSFNQTARRMLSEIEPLGVRLQQIDTRFSGWVGAVADALPHVIEEGGPAGDHAFYLMETAEQSRYMMSEGEEGLAAELSLSGANAWSKLQGTLTSQMTVDFVRGDKTETLSMPALINLSHDPDPDVRKRAYETELAAWDGVKEPLAAAMNGVKGAVNTLNKRRGRTDALHSAIDQARIDRPTLDAMIGAMQDAFPSFRKYLRARGKLLGHANGVPWWDMYAPVGKSDRVYTWPDTQQFIVSNFATFSDRLAKLAERAFGHNWIDAEQRPGKRAGAFCMGLPAVDESRILCNFDGSLDQVSTVAHELGHAFHNECLVGKAELQTQTPMTLAETASIFCETIIADAALADAKTADEEIAILDTDLTGKTQVIVDITSRFLFEQEVFKRREVAELSADELSELMLRFQKETYGDGLNERYLHKYMWTWKPHYYRAGLSFYNFPYAFGLLFALGLYAIYQQRGAAFVPEYEALLASTGEGTAAELAMRFGINIRDKAFWKGSLDLIAQRVDRFASLQVASSE